MMFCTDILLGTAFICFLISIISDGGTWRGNIFFNHRIQTMIQPTRENNGQNSVHISYFSAKKHSRVRRRHWSEMRVLNEDKIFLVLIHRKKMFIL